MTERKMRGETHYCSKDADRFMLPLLQEYQSGSWHHPHRVVFKIEKPASTACIYYSATTAAAEIATIFNILLQSDKKFRQLKEH